MFKIGEGDLAPSSTSPGSSSASDASGRGVVCPSQSSSGRVELLTKLAASSRRPTETAPVDAQALQRRGPRRRPCHLGISCITYRKHSLSILMLAKATKRGLAE